MADYKILSLDESGKASFNHLSKLFILSGIVIPEKFKPKLDRLMRKLKKKFFGDEEIIFHSRDMSRKKGPFSILQDHKMEVAFWAEFISVANNPEISTFFVITDKQEATTRNWQPKTILKRSYLAILEEFTIKQLVKHNGKIVSESDPAQDLYLIQAHNAIQGNGTSDGSISAWEYKQKITCLSLVNKSNQDIDVQMADCLAHIAGMIYEIQKNPATTLSRVDSMKKRLIDRKLASRLNPASFKILI